MKKILLLPLALHVLEFPCSHLLKCVSCYNVASAPVLPLRLHALDGEFYVKTEIEKSEITKSKRSTTDRIPYPSLVNPLQNWASRPESLSDHQSFWQMRNRFSYFRTTILKKKMLSHSLWVQQCHLFHEPLILDFFDRCFLARLLGNLF